MNPTFGLNLTKWEGSQMGMDTCGTINEATIRELNQGGVCLPGDPPGTQPCKGS